VDVSLVIKQRLEELGLEQRDLARAARVTESYVSQLMTQKKLPPAANRTDIYDRMGKLLKLPAGELAKLAELQRQEKLKKKLGDAPPPLFQDVRELILRKAVPEKEPHMRAIFQKQHFGELERLVAQTLLGVVKGVAKSELDNERWLRRVARLSRHTHEQMRAILLDFLDKDIFHLSAENCVSFLDPMIESWDIDLATFSMHIVLNRRVVPGHVKTLAFVERESDPPDEEPGLQAFLHDASLSGDTTAEEIQFLRTLRFKTKRPTALYYYREVQNLRDPLHFRHR